VEVPAGCTGVNAAECQIALVTGTTVYGFALDPLGDIYLLDFNYGSLDEAPQSQGISLSFPGLQVGTACCGTPVTLQNIGNETLNAVNPGLVLNPNWDMSSGEGFCSSSFSLVPGADCDLTIGFAPDVVSQSGTLSGSAEFFDNALNNPGSAQSIYLSGTSSDGDGSRRRRRGGDGQFQRDQLQLLEPKHSRSLLGKLCGQCRSDTDGRRGARKHIRQLGRRVRELRTKPDLRCDHEPGAERERELRGGRFRHRQCLPGRRGERVPDHHDRDPQQCARQSRLG
jgi:hypothetical protein